MSYNRALVNKAYKTKRLSGLFAGLAMLMALSSVSVAASDFSPHLNGDIGLGGFSTRSIIKGQSDTISVLPYLDFKYGRGFARVDTFGIKTLELGYGHLELITRFARDGFETGVPELAGIERRENSMPIGVGSLQVTPMGGLMINAFYDLNKSQGTVVEWIYGGKLALSRATFYPLLGVEFQSSNYVRYYYGISTTEAARSVYAAYDPAAGMNSLVGLIAEIRLSDDYYLNVQMRRKWLGDAIRQSPLVDKSSRDTFYVALSMRFN